MKQEILLIGAGGHAKSIIDIIESMESLYIGGLIGEEGEIGGKVFGYEVIGSDKDLKELRKTYELAFVGIGQIGKDSRRRKLIGTLKELGYKVPKVISNNSLISKYSEIGEGSSISHHVVINPGAKIGMNCILNTKCLIEHDVIIGNNCHISTGVILNGGVKVGNNSFIGSGTIIRENIELGEGTIISAGKRIMGLPLES